VDFKLGPDGDLAVENGIVPLVTGTDAIRQNLLIRLRTVKGEWYQDLRVGVPLYERVLGKVSTPIAIAALFQRIARETPGIASISQFLVDYDPQGRSLSLSGEAETLDGEIIVLEHEDLIL
jgi:hypothetical protein